ELQDRFVEDLHSTGAAANQIGGLQLVLPTTVSNGSYGGILRSNAIWQTSTYDVDNDDILGDGTTTQVNSTSVKGIFDRIMIARSRGKKGPSLILCSTEHYLAYQAATVAIQRIND